MATDPYDAIKASVISDEDAYPKFEQINEVEFERASSDVPDEESVIAEARSLLADEEAPRKRRGRPPGSKNKKPSSRDEKEVAKRLQSIIEGGTGILGVIHEWYAATEEEANDIAEPLAAYLVRQEENSEVIREFLDKYDIIAAGFAMLTYLVRVWRDDTEYRNRTKSASSRQHRFATREDFVTNENFSEQEGEDDVSGTQNNGLGVGYANPQIIG